MVDVHVLFQFLQHVVVVAATSSCRLNHQLHFGFESFLFNALFCNIRYILSHIFSQFFIYILNCLSDSHLSLTFGKWLSPAEILHVVNTGRLLIKLLELFGRFPEPVILKLFISEQ